MDGRLTFPDNGDYVRFLQVLRAIIGPDIKNQSLIDICCHVGTASKQLEFREKTFVDVNDHSAAFPDGNFVKADVVSGNHEVFRKVYDVSTCLDGIEHVHKPDGWLMLNCMECMSAKQILFTPLDAWMVEPHNPDPESHKCVWSPDELPGWASIVFPKWHPTLGIGAFFFWKCPDIASDFARVRAALGA